MKQQFGDVLESHRVERFVNFFIRSTCCIVDLPTFLSWDDVFVLGCLNMLWNH